MNAIVLALLATGCANGAASGGGRGNSGDSFDVSADRPAAPRTLYTMARILVNQHRDAEAEKLLKDATAQTPAYLPAFVALAELQLRRPQGADEALATLAKAIEAAPREALLHNNAGMCQLAKKEYAAALDCFTRAAELDDTSPRYRANRALALGMLGQYDQCLAVYATVLSPADAHHNLAILCKLRGDQQRADSEFAEAQSLRAGSAPLLFAPPLGAPQLTPSPPAAAPSLPEAAESAVPRG